MEFYNPKALVYGALAKEGTTEGLRVINLIAPCVLKSIRPQRIYT